MYNVIQIFDFTYIRCTKTIFTSHYLYFNNFYFIFPIYNCIIKKKHDTKYEMEDIRCGLNDGQ